MRSHLKESFKNMANKVDQFKQWLMDERYFRSAWFAKDPQMKPAPEEALSQLPAEMTEELVDLANDLPTHPDIQKAVVEAVEGAIAQWEENPQTSINSMVILGEPVSSVSRIMADALQQLRDKRGDLLPTRLLSWIERPADVKTIQQQVKEALQLEQDPDAYETAEDEHPPKLMLIPNLCWCFLRSADGLDGLDYLQDLLPRDRHQFWLLGSGVVGWEYLSSTLKFHAYCGDTVHLPSLSGEQLQSWLSPMVEKFDIQFPATALHKRLQDPKRLLHMDLDIDKPVEALAEVTQEVRATVKSTVKSSVQAVKESVTDGVSDDKDSPERNYFQHLADIAQGSSIVALQIFIKSLRYRVYDAESQSIKTEPQMTESDSPELVATVPKLPPLPDLSQSDMYLLYSLLLHGDMTVRALAKSLGDAPQVVNNQVQMLRKSGLIEQRGKVLKTNPAHYPRLKKELNKNNFIVNVG